MKSKSKPRKSMAVRAASSARRQCILVAGMHRSGTSAATRVINLLGADISPDLMPPSAGDNDRGFWESWSIFAAHDRLLKALGSDWDDPFPLSEHWTESSAAREAQEAVEDIIDRDFPKSRLFVVKDPRLARLLPLWLKPLADRDIEPIVVIPFRNPLEVAQSLAKRNKLPIVKSLSAYVRSNLEVELASRGRKRLFIDYGDLLSNWRAFAKRLGNVVGPAIRAPSTKTIADIEGFLTADLYRQRATRDDLVSEPQSSATAIEIYDRLKEAAKTGNDAALRRSFNHLERTTTDMMRVLRALLVPPPAAAITSPVEQAPHTDAALEEAAVDEVTADKDAAIGRVEPTEVIHHALNLMADARADLARRLDEVSARAAGLEELRLSLATQLAAADANAAHAVNNISGLEAARAELTRQLGEVRAGAAESASVRETLQRELDEARAAAERLEAAAREAEIPTPAAELEDRDAGKGSRQGAGGRSRAHRRAGRAPTCGGRGSFASAGRRSQGA